MIIKNKLNVPVTSLEDETMQRVYRQILIGPEDGSLRIVMRLFRVEPDGFTPHHSHDFEHVVKVEKGKGIVVDPQGRENVIHEGDCIFIPANEKHQFRNPFPQPFEFLCIIVNQD